MKIYKSFCAAILSVFSVLAAAGEKAPQADAVYRFDNNSTTLKLSGGAYIKDGLLHFDSPGAAELPGSSKYSITPAGLTMTALVRFHAKPAGHDLGEDIFSKGREWLFSRHGKGMLYLSHSSDVSKGKKFYGGVRAGRIVPAGEWAHYTAVFQRIQRQGQGETGYLQKVYINGEQVGQAQVLDIEPLVTSAPVVFGYGLAKDAWALRGAVEEITISRRAWNDDEVERAALACGKVKVPGGAKAEVTAELKVAIKALKPHQQEALQRAAKAGADQKILAEAVKLFAANKKQSVITIWSTPRLEAMLITKGANTAFPLISLYDKTAQREIFGRRTLGWEIKLKNSDSNLRYVESEFNAQTLVSGKNQAIISWDCSNGVIVKMPLKLSGNRLEASLSISNSNKSVMLEEVLFPRFTFRKLNSGIDKLVIPFMSGIELANPTVATSSIAQQNYIYPTSDVNMQFHVYYDAKSGIYFAHEDPTGAVKNVSTMPKRGDLDASYSTSIGRVPGNSYTLSGVAAVEVFDGNWYEGAQIYRNFVQERAMWAIKEFPRKDTPEHLRKSVVTVEVRTRYNYTPGKMPPDMIKFQKYLELPFIIHWVDWDDISKGSWPHFFAKDDSLEAVKVLNRAKIFSEVYIDTRLWAEKDGPGRRSIWMYKPFGERYAVRNAENNIPFESYNIWFHEPGPGKRGWYSERHRYAVLCPAARGWQEWILWLTERVAGYGFTGIYHDQVMAAAPHICFSTEHGHVPGDAQAWVRDGYYPMLKTMREKTRTRFPYLTHSTEDFAEAYIPLFDTCFCWRWTHEQIPLVDAVYGGGSIIIGNRLYGDGGKKGDINALYAKSGEQLVRGEQLGYYLKEDIENPDAALYIKRCAHLRNNLLSFFTAGRMLKNWEYASPVPVVSAIWNAYKGGSGGGDVPIKTPAVQQGRWQRLSDKAEVAVFWNTTNKDLTVQPLKVPAAYTMVSAGTIAPYTPGSAITVKAFEAVMLYKNVKESELLATQKVLQLVAGFSAPGVGAQREIAAKNSNKALLVKDAVKYRNLSPAEDGSFAGWILPGATLTFENVFRGKKVLVELNGKIDTTVRLLFNNKTAGMVKLGKSGRQTVVFTPGGDSSNTGEYLLHFPEGATEFYIFKVEK